MALLHRMAQGLRLLLSCFSTIYLGCPLHGSGWAAATSWLRLTGGGQKAWNGRPWLGKSTSHFPSNATGGLSHVDKLNCKGSWEISYSNSAPCPAKEAGKCSAAGRLPAHHCPITTEEGNMDFCRTINSLCHRGQ